MTSCPDCGSPLISIGPLVECTGCAYGWESDGPMTGETKDAIGGFVAYLQALSLRQRRDAMLELLDHACQRCGSELPKWGPCEVCGQLRPDDE